MANLPDGLEWTAVVVAAQRAVESLSAAPAFRDPLAEAVVTHLGLAEPGEPPRFEDMPGDMAGVTKFVGPIVVLRTLHYDRVLTDAGLDQVVLLGAGLDGRAYRLPWAGRRIFELDLPAGLLLKAEAARAAGLEPIADRVPVPVDLAAEWAPVLLEAGFDPERPTAWVAEGLLLYLTRDQADQLMTRVHELSAPGSRFCLDVVETLGERFSAVDDDGGRRAASVMRHGPPTPPHDWLAAHGWSPDAVTLVELGDRYGRTITPGFDPGQGGARLWCFDSAALPRGSRPRS